uniref:Uncharacterized protein n=2 Tax=Oryza nivara TaxID=4536 RepID=A0A0E0J2N5_ORYNI
MVPPMHTEAGSSQFQGAFSGVPQVNMPVFSTATQNYGHVDLSGVEVVRRSVRERHSPKRLSLSGCRPPTGARRKGKKKDTNTSRNFDDEANE